MRMVAASTESIALAASCLKQGRLVVIPTETVYGLGANALDGQAVARIFVAKGRPQFNPLIVHVADMAAAEELVEMSDAARAVAAQFWPGPLTMILPRRADCPVSELCSAGLPTLAVRVPAHKVAREILRVSGVPVAAPSANRSGHISPTTPQIARQSLGDQIDLVIAAGACENGLESTILDLSSDRPVILRAGHISAEEIADIIGDTVSYETHAVAGEDVKSPGQLLRHYAPHIPVRLNAVGLKKNEALLAFGSIKFMGIEGGGAASSLPDTAYRNLSETGDLHEAAANLFRMLHELDNPANGRIAVMSIPQTGVGIAINERLSRAAAAHDSQGADAL